MFRTILIVPAVSDIAGQCRLVVREHEGQLRDALANYRRSPELWKECGVMNSAGRLVCFDGLPQERAEIVACEPLRAPLQFTFPASRAAWRPLSDRYIVADDMPNDGKVVACFTRETDRDVAVTLINSVYEIQETLREALRCIDTHIPPTVFAPRERLRAALSLLEKIS